MSEIIDLTEVRRARLPSPAISYRTEEEALTALRHARDVAAAASVLLDRIYPGATPAEWADHIGEGVANRIATRRSRRWVRFPSCGSG